MSEATSFVPQASQPKPTAAPRLRLWPGVVIVALEWLVITVPGWVAPATMTQFMGMLWGPVLALVALVLCWLFASRLPWSDRWLGVFACAAAGAVVWPFYHATFGLFGVALYALPVVTTAWVVWAVISYALPRPIPLGGLLAVFVLAWGYFALVRFVGIDGSMAASFEYRWSPTAEEKFQAERAARQSTSEAASLISASSSLKLQPGDWPGFRGPNRDGRRMGVRIPTDWQAHPPQLLWRQRVGPGWSSFAVVGNHLFTQEQRGGEEAVVCYDTDTGTELWAHVDAARFTELVSGPGPRATPTFQDGKLYALGAAGRLNCLDAATGRVLWTRDVVADSGAKVPTWGFASSPLVLQGIASVFVGGPEGKSVLGYHAATGELAWSAGEDQLSYCSLQPARVGDREQLLLATEGGLTAFDPLQGEVLWRHSWPLEQGMARVVQPTLLDDGDVLIGTGFGMGTRRVHIVHQGSTWSPEEVWTTRAINPYFNDLVVHGGHLYGFDGSFFTCVNLADGKKVWRARGYGNGQVLLLADQNLLLVLSEKGEAALVEATPAGHTERGRFQALEGKTWNHPVVAHGKLFVRNDEEARCYQLVETSGGGSVGN